MDVRDITNVFVAKDCARTAGSDTFPTGFGTITTGVQIFHPLTNLGAAANSYIGAGELLVTNLAGINIVSGGSYTKDEVPGIKFIQRTSDGLGFIGSAPIKLGKVTSYNVYPYKARVEQTTVVEITTTPVIGTTYMLKIRRLASDNAAIKETTVRSISFKAATTSITDLATGLTAAINSALNEDTIMPVTAAVVNTDEISITALPLPFDLEKFKNQRLQFVVEFVNLDGAFYNNMYGALSRGTVTATAATIGQGTYKQVAELESAGLLYTGANRDKLQPSFKTHEVPLNAVSTATYDTVVINWENLQGDFSGNVNQQGTVTLFLPVSVIVGEQTEEIVTILDDLLVTTYGIGSAQVGNLS